ncbi:uncharacterized protein [Typha latifolia]|uniref:uncharacterized protein n=1 Tax=Typha latifolia TaxID=4733 RepID=UPI003C301E5A
MGSLMAGWDVPVKDPKAVMYQRNKSLTRGQIDAYWKTKNKSEEEQLKHTCSDINKNQENIYQVARERFKRSNTLPLTDRRGSTVNSSLEPDVEMMSPTNCWWTRSNWAFLNEPPVTAMEGPSYKYASQYHATDCQQKSSEKLKNQLITSYDRS